MGKRSYVTIPNKAGPLRSGRKLLRRFHSTAGPYRGSRCWNRSIRLSSWRLCIGTALRQLPRCTPGRCRRSYTHFPVVRTLSRLAAKHRRPAYSIRSDMSSHRNHTTTPLQAPDPCLCTSVQPHNWWCRIRNGRWCSSERCSHPPASYRHNCPTRLRTGLHTVRSRRVDAEGRLPQHCSCCKPPRNRRSCLGRSRGCSKGRPSTSLNWLRMSTRPSSKLRLPRCPDTARRRFLPDRIREFPGWWS
jgi:hypothetical protein